MITACNLKRLSREEAQPVGYAAKFPLLLSRD
jgi:hypothetical protein